jgi:hypothetical protein
MIPHSARESKTIVYFKRVQIGISDRFLSSNKLFVRHIDLESPPGLSDPTGFKRIQETSEVSRAQKPLSRLAINEVYLTTIIEKYKVRSWIMRNRDQSMRDHVMQSNVDAQYIEVWPFRHPVENVEGLYAIHSPRRRRL